MLFFLPNKNIQKIIFESISLTKDGIGIFDENDKLVFCNTPLAQLFGVSKDIALNKSFSELVHICFNSPSGVNIEAPSAEVWLENALLKRRSSPFRTFETDTQDGTWYVVTEQLVQENYLYTYITDITEKKINERMLKELSEKFKEISITDYLTQLHNRRHFYEKAEAEFNLSTRKKQPLSVLTIDIDNFKRINDQYSHSAGDTVLKAFAESIRPLLRNYDLFARIGGEEFALLLPNTEKAHAKIIAERIRTLIEGLKIPFKTELLNVTVSIGISEYDAQKSLEQMMMNADKNLYIAKSKGRNQIV